MSWPAVTPKDSSDGWTAGRGPQVTPPASSPTSITPLACLANTANRDRRSTVRLHSRRRRRHCADGPQLRRASPPPPICPALPPTAPGCPSPALTPISSPPNSARTGNCCARAPKNTPPPAAGPNRSPGRCFASGALSPPTLRRTKPHGTDDPRSCAHLEPPAASPAGHDPPRTEVPHRAMVQTPGDPHTGVVRAGPAEESGHHGNRSPRGAQQQSCPRPAWMPSRTARAAIPTPTTGSSHHQPSTMLASRPTKTAAAR